MRRRWSINTLLLAGMGGLLFGGVLVSATVSEQVLSEANGRRDLLIYYSQIHDHSQDQLLGMVNQEVGLGGYLATGDRRFLEPYARGKEEQRGDSENLLQGVELTYRSLLQLLTRQSVVEIQALGQPFDPSIHEAVRRVPTSDKPPGTVVDVYQKGYMLKDRMLRPAMVAVAAEPA